MKTAAQKKAEKKEREKKKKEAQKKKTKETKSEAIEKVDDSIVGDESHFNESKKTSG